MNSIAEFFRLLFLQKYRISLYSFFLATLILLPGQNKYEKATLSSIKTSIKKLPMAIPTPAPYPVSLNIYPVPSLSAKSVMLFDVASGKILYEKNADTPLPPASTTKIMTALVTLDYFKPDDVVTVKKVINEGRIMGLVPGEKITVEALLYGMLVHSANDAAYALASAFPSGEQAFVQAMNEKAILLHLTNSHFTNPIGFDNSDHRMSSHDLVLLARIALKNPLIAKMVSTRSITVSDVTYTYFHDLFNVNELLGQIPGVAGLKTGYTKEAGESLITLLVRPQAKLIAVILGSHDRFGEMKKLLSWGLQNFLWEKPSVLEMESFVEG